MRKAPVVAITLGDPSGIGPELVAKLLASEQRVRHCHCVLVGDEWLWKNAQTLTRLMHDLPVINAFEEAEHTPLGSVCFLPVSTMAEADHKVGIANKESGASVLNVLTMCLDAAKASEIDAICFAPLNKQAMKLAGMPFEDELHFFADQLEVEEYFCEFNTLGDIWTSRISSHVPFKDVTQYLSQDRIIEATKLIHDCLIKSGVARPKIAIAALNPHGGDGGICGREEIDIIQPAVKTLQDQHYPVSGPFPADTLFLKVRDGEFDAVVTMYHDQGQIAIKLLGFEKGVTVQGGLPIAITTPAHGTAFDISGKNQANVNATLNAFNLACVMAQSAFKETLATNNTEA
ncbi:4-hydroxythreonine-4-phosphate dehydrogenase [Enterovibrio norvegicus]|uniref:4-hydroxythreonine-4-phosphate dehydrogenase n=2 Tax=Enterovibrio norvegicus TaxID=188144 RepID=A0A1I5LBD3_9GAMM|nr:4-hydroxythreonine-4-phosphate dehydrogenase PdxA [Enterovibrio norvegicus]OEF58131.1 4-hydroxythreonine-4-phosphate dehydrogenase [Enterovibrio norvegicus]OEF62582.1 4-hydroxythreonine-4-phosphate dehydrogenase [Enterovibrio norvegicus]PMI40801.1 4-hydroxythreonine-4-phosphate dehydrogenase [Enterovibrio norvegicus]PMN56311.1 4-hydroxythreonine-4-phosphate dehydrogenase [Enterovibrio norvegicus]TKF35186.1 4-hydroxythreonine-4-phosphate dehydrogenase PdxA [Enterovibrio norvegicus]